MLNSKRQHFQSGVDAFEIPVVSGDRLTEGRDFVLWDDIKEKVPVAASFQREKRKVNFMTDSSGKSLQPLRIEHRPGSTIEIILSPSIASSAPPQYFSQDLRPHPPSSSRASHKREEEKTKGESILATPGMSSDAKTRFRSSIVVYESFLKSMQAGQTAQAKLLKEDFRDHFSLMMAEMSKHRELQQQMFEMQQSMLEMQQRALDRLALIQSRVQSILVLNLELRECPVPRLFIILPRDASSTKFDPVHLHHNRFRLYFLCECGEHTQSTNGYTNPHHIHLAKHEGYEIESPVEFFRQYGAHVLSLLQMLKYGVTVGQVTVPALVPPKPTGPDGTQNDSSDGNIEPFVNCAIDYLQFQVKQGHISIPTTTPGPGLRGKIEHKVESGVQEGLDLQRLEAFLRFKGGSKGLGNLNRMMTKEGHVKWVCSDHYRERYNAMAIKELSEVVSINRGTFNEHLGRVEISLASSFVATHFYRVMERGKFVQELKLVLAWDLSTHDLKTLRDVICNSRIARLDLTCTAPNSTSDILGRSKKADPLWHIILTTRLQSFVLNNFSGFFSRVSIPARTTYLTVLRIPERVDWRKEGGKVIELLRQSPRLTELHLGCSNIEEAYAAIRRTTAGFCPMEQIALDGGAMNGMLVRFQKSEPVWMDLLLSDMTSPLLFGAKGLQSLHLRPGPSYSQVEMDPHFLERLVYQNPVLTKLSIECPVSDFQRSFMVIKEALSMSRTSVLNSLNLYCNRNQMYATNLQKEAAVKLELMSTGVPADTLDSLLKIHGSRLTKLRVEGETFRSLAFLGLTLRHTGTILSRLDIASSALSATMLRDLRLILRSCQSTLSHLSIVIYMPWEGSKANVDLAEFIVEHGASWTEITVGVVEVSAWREALGRRGFFVPDRIVNVVPSFVRRLTKLEAGLGVIPPNGVSKLDGPR